MNDQNSSLAKKVLSEIKKQDIEVVPRFQHQLKNLVKWLGALFYIFLAGHSLGIIIYFVSDFNFSLLPIILKTPGKYEIITMILFWLLLFVFTSAVTIARYRKTKRGYKAETIVVLAFVMSASFFIGWISYSSEISSYLDKKLYDSLPYYESWEAIKIKVWTNPEDGLLAGEIKDVLSQKTLVLQSFTGQIWQVDLKKALVRDKVSLHKGQVVKLLGQTTDLLTFSATEVRPWDGRMKSTKRCLNVQDKTKCIKER